MVHAPYVLDERQSIYLSIYLSVYIYIYIYTHSEYVTLLFQGNNGYAIAP